MEFKPERFQMAIFLSGIDLSSKIEIAKSMADCCGGIFQSDPIMIPVPPDAPSEFPLIILKNDNSGWSVQLNRERADIVVEPFRSSSSPDYMSYKGKLIEVTMEMWDRFSKQFNAKSVRLGLITTMTSNIEKPIEFINNNFLSVDDFQDANDANLNFLRKFSRGQFYFNLWTRFIGQNKYLDRPSNFIVEHDVNTQIEKPITIDEKNLSDFLKLGFDIIEENLQRVK